MNLDFARCRISSRPAAPAQPRLREPTTLSAVDADVEGRVTFRTSAASQQLERLMFESIGMPELIVILVLALVLFGSKKIPELGKGLGEGIRNFRASLKGEAEAGAKNS
jgi:sec-independent protein translocase protein TatA